MVERSHSGRVVILLGDLARKVVEKTAPEQLDLFAEVTAQWADGRVPGRRRHGWLGGSVGSGFEHVVTSEVIYPLLSGTLAQVLGTAVATRRWRRRRRDVPPLPQVRVALDAGQIAAFRSICISHGMTLGLSEAEATLLADAVHGVLVMAASGQER
ncbi:hypothetical protein [Actinomadura sp. DC4]|uniref:hypothetical protein n=1 Tax=Actinomadura sp. DC4 TaxID=3055069 RepID=UPI0025B153C4|nr:hypothetical protein [Actinomadura sp. DC4]MDN3357881.1 hypothetical protein [Actinomadura sp. DC4]